MSINGNRIFRTFLLIEAVANTGAIFPLNLSPKMCLLYLVKHPLQVTPVALSLTQWSGALLVPASVPLLISYSEPTSNQAPGVVRAPRRMTTWTLGAAEVVLGILTAGQYLSGDSGITDTALLTMMGTFEWMEGEGQIC